MCCGEINMMNEKIKEFYNRLVATDMISGDVMLSMLVRDFEATFQDELTVKEKSNDNNNRSK